MTKFQYDVNGEEALLPKSRSQKKRDSTALQKQGEEYLTLNEKQWQELELSPELKEALGIYKTLKSHEAKRRQLQFIGRIIRENEEKNENND